MDLPFSHEQFFDVFARYNDAVWPAQFLLVAVGFFCAVGGTARRGWSRAIASTLACLWMWMAVAYHFLFFTRINPMAWLFGAVFVVAAGLFALQARKPTLRFDGADRPQRAAGLALIGYALIAYPLIGSFVGHAYPRSPTFGLPCPTTIFTLGMLLLARPPVRGLLFVVPILWSVVGTFAAIQLGVIQDYGLPVAALVTVVFLVRNAIVRSPHSVEPRADASRHVS